MQPHLSHQMVSGIMYLEKYDLRGSRAVVVRQAAAASAWLSAAALAECGAEVVIARRP